MIVRMTVDLTYEDGHRFSVNPEQREMLDELIAKGVKVVLATEEIDQFTKDVEVREMHFHESIEDEKNCSACIINAQDGRH